MECCKGSLADYLHQNPKISRTDGLLIWMQVLIAVEHLHSVGFAHLDIQLAKILFVQRYNMTGDFFLLSDLGTAKKSPVLLKKREEEIPGNLLNRSPELFIREKFAQLNITMNDVWASGCIGYELFERHHPFVRESENLVERICGSELPTLSMPNSFAMNRLLHMMWERNPNKRVLPVFAVRICGMLLWGCPVASAVDIHRPNTMQEFQSLCALLASVTAAKSEKWLMEQRQSFFHHHFNIRRSNCHQTRLLHASELLQLHYLVNTTPDMLCKAIKCFASC